MLATQPSKQDPSPHQTEPMLDRVITGKSAQISNEKRMASPSACFHRIYPAFLRHAFASAQLVEAEQFITANIMQIFFNHIISTVGKNGFDACFEVFFA